ncbi:preprotein translocase subunit SecG [Dongia sp. agr-C8]
MPEIIYTVFRVIQVFLAIGLVGIIVLMQRSEGGLGGLGGGGGGGAGGMGGFLTGRAQANVITRTTAILAAGFLASTLILAYGDHAGRGKPTTLVPATSTAPAAPTNNAPANTGPEIPAGSSSGGDSGATAPSAPATPAEPAAPAAPTGQ